MKTEYQINDLLEVTIRKIVPRGLGIAFMPGLTIFVPLAAAGDQLVVRLKEVRGKTATAEIERIVEPSPDRTDPACSYFGTCGGCDLQHLKYEAQLDAKVEILRDCLTRIGKIDEHPSVAVIPCPQPLGYRSRAQWQVDGRRRAVGYFRRESHEVVDVVHCPILVPELQEEITKLRTKMETEALPEKSFQVDAVSGDGGEVSLFSPELSASTAHIAVSALGERFSFSAWVFFQGNRFLVEKLVETAIGDAAGTTALDLYCGVGLFTLPLARRFASVIGVEESEEAIRFANRSAEEAGLANVELYAASVRDYLASGEAERPDFVLLDPPRSGTEKGTIESLIGLEPPRISYVSCDPAMLARDLRQFVEKGYRIHSITAIDLFPQTHHVETVVQMAREI